MIREATFNDLPYILNIIKKCTNHMIKNKIFQWNENYPSKEIFIDDIKNFENVTPASFSPDNIGNWFIIILILNGEII